MELNLSSEDLIILNCCCAQPQPEQIKTIELMLSPSIDWEYIQTIGKYHDISSLIYKSLSLCNNRSIIPPNIYEKLHNEYTITAFKNLLFIKEYNRIAKSFNIQNIKLIPLKGIAFLKDLYDNIALRSLMDIDILIQQQDKQRAGNILKDMGYKMLPHTFYLRDTHFHFTFIKTIKRFSLSVEIHWDIDFSDSAYNITIDDFWHRAKPVVDESLLFYKLSPDDSILLNCFHILRDPHYQAGIISLKNLSDIYAIIKQNGQEINFNLVIERAKTYRIKRPILLVLLLVQELFHTVMPFNILDCMKEEGFNVEMMDTLLTERIFLKNIREPFHLPGGLRLQSSSQGRALRISLFDMLTELYKSVRAKYDAFQSVRKSLLPIFRMIVVSLFNYIKVLLIYVIHQKDTSQKLLNKIISRDNLTKIDSWLRGGQTL